MKEQVSDHLRKKTLKEMLTYELSAEQAHRQYLK